MKYLKHFQKRNTTSKGFTLAELAITAAIISILSGIAIPSYLSIISNQAMRGASLAATEWLENVRKRALETNSSCTVLVNANGETLSPGTGNNCGNFQSLFLNQISTSGPTPSFCFFGGNPLNTAASCNSSNTGTSQTIIFSPRGTTLNSGVFSFRTASAEARHCTIVLAPLGVIRAGRVLDGICNTRL